MGFLRMIAPLISTITTRLLDILNPCDFAEFVLSGNFVINVANFEIEMYAKDIGEDPTLMAYYKYLIKAPTFSLEVEEKVYDEDVIVREFKAKLRARCNKQTIIRELVRLLDSVCKGKLSA